MEVLAEHYPSFPSRINKQSETDGFPKLTNDIIGAGLKYFPRIAQGGETLPLSLSLLRHYHSSLHIRPDHSDTNTFMINGDKKGFPLNFASSTVHGPKMY